VTPARPTSNLADLSRYGLARVRRVLGEDAAAQRLRELGFTPGTEVDFVRRAPFGGPLIVQLRGYQLALRPAEARRVEIETTGDVA
jgi:ferrous iron transport protein A